MHEAAEALRELDPKFHFDPEKTELGRTMEGDDEEPFDESPEDPPIS
jgi:hypothetical protein